ncbi:MAG: hypothetical protein EBV81_03290 [Proteobacteria bacterium]|nr:hypothetical protein [Candidatus Fonsibacter sp. PEL5]
MNIKKIYKYFLKILLIIFISFFLFLIIDYYFGKIFIDKYLQSIKDDPVYHKKQRVRHDFFHHTLAPNIDYKKTGWGPKIYRLCTDEWGLKYKCNTKSKNTYKLAIIGDSFVEGIGIPYEETFAGIINLKTIPEIANLGVSSYSPKIYYSKLKYFIEKGFKFNHVIIFVDVSDLIDDMNSYVLLRDGKVRDKKWNKQIEWYINAKFPVLDQLIFKFTKNNRYRATDTILTPLKIFTSNENLKIEDIKKIYDKKMNLRAMWTYTNETKIKGYDYGIDQGIEEQIRTMDMIYDYLTDRKIKLSVAVYPWPQTILYDVPYNKHVKIWEEFCKRRCVNFINHYPLFMNINDSDEKKIEIIKKYYQVGDIHFNSEGNKLIAEDFLKKFKF